MNDCAAPRHDGEPRPAEPHARLCAPCKAGLRRDLHRLPALDRELGQLLDPRRCGGTGHGDGGGLPYHDAASEARSQIRHDLAWWIRQVTAERQPPTCPVRTVAAMAGWLAGWVQWASHRPWAGDLAAAFAEDRSRAIAIIDPMPRAEIPIPPDVNWCPPGHGGCGQPGGLHATVYQAPGDKRPAMVTCGNCWQQWDAVQWLRLGQAIVTWRDTKAASCTAAA